ncbi:mycothiol synthase [Kitasatospora sp. NPDC050543]|uniref:mycothiol synthase n=1 Tax=Kitasatospora sp. NPDC050543 TaxID=3364054 RepID=UPI00379F6997
MDAETGASPARERFYFRAPGIGESGIVAGPVLRSGWRDSALHVLAAAQVEDGREAVSEQGRLRLRSSDVARPGVTHFIQFEERRNGLADPLQADAGYAQLDESAPGAVPSAELAVAPAFRGRGFGRHLIDTVLDEAEGEYVDFWAHGGHPAARHLAEHYGAELVRELRQMRRGLSRAGEAEAGPAGVALPEGITLRTFRPGADDAQWLRLNALAFAHHPEQGAWTERDLADRVAEPWFDPAGFFLATRGERVVGFHWTKVHPATDTEPALGEVYVVGVDPAEQGSGLGRALTAAGLRHLAVDRGLETVLLYVDADNPAAVRVYERLGFTIHEVDLMYRVQHREDRESATRRPRP